MSRATRSAVRPIYDGKKYDKLDIDDEEDGSFAQMSPVAGSPRCSTTSSRRIVPPQAEAYRLSRSACDGDELAATRSRARRRPSPAGTAARFSETLFVGPKLQAQLEKVGPSLELHRRLRQAHVPVAPAVLAARAGHGFFGNWGWAIIIVTILLKLVFYKLSETSGRSMAKMRTIAPRIKSMQERYKDDREQLAKQMMELYKSEKINPVAGCLPILVQIPVFLAFYWVLLESVEMRQAPFFGWIQDLSAQDPFFILPILMGVAMFVQFKLNPTPPDPMQAKVFAFMPMVMTVMFAFFPAGLVLYWVTNTLLSIAQQWNINRAVEAEAKKRG